MNIETQLELKSEYALVSCKGDYDRDELMNVWETAFQYAASENRTAVMVDVRGLGGPAPTTMDRYDLAVRMVEMQRAYGKDIALAVLGNEPFVEPGRFGEVIGRSLGGFGRVFTDYDEAVEWIARNSLSEGALI